MLKTRLLATLVCGLIAGFATDSRAQCRFPRSQSNTTWTYRFRAESGIDGLVLHVTAQFPLGPSGVLALQLPVRWAGETLHAMTNLRSESANVHLEIDPDGGSGVLRGGPNKLATITYDLKKDWTGPLVHPRQFHPVLMPEYFEFTGQNALVFPQLDTPQKTGARTTAQMDFTGLPSSWTLATSFGAGTSTADRCQVATVSAAEIVNALFAAGDFRLREFLIGRRRAILAARGTWTFSDEDAIGEIQKTVGVIRDFWKDDDFPYFLVTLKPYDRDRGSSDGSEFTNAFWMYLSRQESFADRLPQLAHESFHAWNPHRMGLWVNGEPIPWFAEGFTDYYSSRLLLQAGVLSTASYIDSLNQTLRRFPSSSDPYVRGRIIALWLDAKIRLESHDMHSLDDVMFEMVRGRYQPLTQERILSTIALFIPPDARVELEAAVTKRAALVAPGRVPAVSGCENRSLLDVPTFDLGFDLAASRAAGKVTGVRTDGAAYAAGLRDGQILSGRLSVTNGDPQRAALFTVRDDAGEREVQFFPRGPVVQAWQYQISDCSNGH